MMRQFLKILKLLFYSQCIIIILTHLRNECYSFVKCSESSDDESFDDESLEIEQILKELQREYNQDQNEEDNPTNDNISEINKTDALKNDSSSSNQSKIKLNTGQHGRVNKNVKARKVKNREEEERKFNEQNSFNINREIDARNGTLANPDCYRLDHGFFRFKDLGSITDDTPTIDATNEIPLPENIYDEVTSERPKITFHFMISISMVENKIDEINRLYIQSDKASGLRLISDYTNLLVELNDRAVNFLNYFYKAEQFTVLKLHPSILKEHYLLITKNFYEIYAKFIEHLFKYFSIKEEVAYYEVQSLHYELTYKFFIWDSNLTEYKKTSDDIHFNRLLSNFLEPEESKHKIFSLSVLVLKSHLNDTNWIEKEICEAKAYDDAGYCVFEIKIMYNAENKHIGFIFLYKSSDNRQKSRINTWSSI